MHNSYAGKQPDFNLFFMCLALPSFLTGWHAPADHLIISTHTYNGHFTGIIIVISVLYPI